MVSVFDVAAYILSRLGPMSARKLQKLVFYCQVWSLVWTDQPLFTQKIEAWKDGPVVRELYGRHRNLADVQRIDGEPDHLSGVQRDTVDNVLGYYGNRSADWLVHRTHEEEPWRKSRRRLSPWHFGTDEITHASILEYYGKS